MVRCRPIRSIPPTVIDELARAAEPGLVATTGPRYFGFVTGGALPATVAAEWLTATWDQNAGLYVMSPAASVVEEVAGRWLIELLGAAAAGRASRSSPAPHGELHRARRGATRSAAACRMGRRGRRPAGRAAAARDRRRRSARVGARRAADARLRIAARRPRARRRTGPDAARRAGAAIGGSSAPTIVCAQAGNVNTGAFDPLEAIADIAQPRGRVAARRRRVRIVGGAPARAAASRARHRARRLVRDRRAQMAERAVRFRARVHRAPGGAPGGDERERRVSGPRRRRSRASRWTGCRSRPAARAASPSTRRSGRWAEAASPISSIAAAGSRGASPIACARSRRSASSTTWS